jgi:hypothetical protein
VARDEIERPCPLPGHAGCPGFQRTSVARGSFSASIRS